MNLPKREASDSIPWEGAWETSGIRFRCNKQDAGIPCAFQALLGAVVVVVGGVEVADQHPGAGIAQSFIHHFLVPTPAQEVTRGGAESPDVTIGSVLAPTGLVGVDHWAGADTVSYFRHRRLAPAGHLVNGSDDRAEAYIPLSVSLRGGLRWGRLPGGCKAVGKQDFTLTPALSIKREGELKDPGAPALASGYKPLSNVQYMGYIG